MKLAKLAGSLVLSCAFFGAPLAQAITFEALGNTTITENGGALEITLSLSATEMESANGTCDVSVVVTTDDVAPATVAPATEDVDYTSVATSVALSLPASTNSDVSTTEVVTIPISDDAEVEAMQEGFALFVDATNSPACFNQPVPDLAVDLLISDDDPLQVSIGPDVSVAEDADIASVSLLTLNPGPAAAVTADVVVATADGTASAGDDYDALSQSFALNVNNPDAVVEVSIVDDADVESDETFSVSITSISAFSNGFPVLTAVQPGTAVVTIEDNDVGQGGGGPVTAVDVNLEFVDDLVFFRESAPFAILEVVPSAAPVADVTVDFTTVDGNADSPADYIAVSGTLTFPAGAQGPQTIMIPLMNDSDDEGQEVFDVVLSDAVGATLNNGDTGVVAIQDDDTGVSSDVTLRGAPGSTVTFTVDVTQDTSAFATEQAFSDLTITGAQPATVTYSAVIPANAVDGQRFEDGIVNEIDFPPPAVVFVTLIAETATTSTTEFGFAVVGSNIDEGQGSIDLQIQRTGDLSNSGQVSFQTLGGGTATAGADFEAITGTVVFAPGEAGPAFATVTILDDQDVEGDEEFQVELFDPVGGVVSTGDSLAIVTINDDDSGPPPVISSPGTVQFAVEELAVNEGDGTITLEVTRINGSDGDASVEFLTVEDTATDGEDFTGTSGVLTWPAGDSDPRTISIELIPCLLYTSPSPRDQRGSRMPSSA